MGPLAEIKRTSSFHPTPHFFDGHRRPRLYRTCILNQLISLFKYPSRLSAKPNLGGTGGHFDPRIVQTSPEMTRSEANVSDEVGAEVSAWDGYITGRNLTFM
jgi:hypothetical protein